MMSLNEIDWNDENELDFYDISCYDPGKNNWFDPGKFVYDGSRKIKDESVKIDKKTLKTKEIYKVWNFEKWWSI